MVCVCVVCGPGGELVTDWWNLVYVLTWLLGGEVAVQSHCVGGP